MRVLYFTEKDSPHDRRFLNALANTEHQVFALRQHDCQPLTPDGITELDWPDGRPDWSNWDGWEEGKRKFNALIKEIKPDLVHAGPIQGPAFLAALSGFHPIVTMSWGSDLLRTAQRSPWMHWATQFALDRTDIFTGDCRAVADEAARYGFPRKKMVLFPWGVDLAHFSPDHGRQTGQDLRKSLSWENNFVVLCNRTWASVYGVDVLAEGFTKAVKDNPNLRLLLAGDGPDEEKIRAILAPVAQQVYLPGRVGLEALPGLYAAADLFVSPSHCDGSSVSLMEALACGKPVLASDIPSNREWVKPGEVGDLFWDGDADSLARGLLSLAVDPELKTYGLRARLLAEERADWDRNFEALLCAYRLAVKA
jgi:glycosyltransferase involved in cell wall biosynthesis